MIPYGTREIIINVAMFAGLLVPAVWFLIGSVRARRSRPEFWQRGLWFIFAFLIFFLLTFVNIALSPVMVIVALIMAFIRKEWAKRVLCFALGEVAATVYSIVWVGLVNYYTFPG